MFDMGFTEVVLIGVVALVVIGPERLPAVAVTVGKYVGRLKRFMTNVRADVESELKTDEIRKLLAAQQEELSSLKDVVSEASKGLDMSGVAKSIDESVSSVLEKSEVPTLEQSPSEPETSPVENAVAESASTSTEDSSVVEPKKKR
tara:strand:+ start:16828 stop:17265 length:438 start_codon:yes stop_codon:yes gene_type:complete